MSYWKSERPQAIIAFAAALIFLALIASPYLKNLPFRAEYGDVPADAKGRVCGQCDRLIEQDVLKCPHCGH